MKKQKTFVRWVTPFYVSAHRKHKQQTFIFQSFRAVPEALCYDPAAESKRDEPSWSLPGWGVSPVGNSVEESGITWSRSTGVDHFQWVEARYNDRPLTVMGGQVKIDPKIDHPGQRCEAHGSFHSPAIAVVSKLGLIWLPEKLDEKPEPAASSASMGYHHFAHEYERFVHGAAKSVRFHDPRDHRQFGAGSLGHSSQSQGAQLGTCLRLFFRCAWHW